MLIQPDVKNFIAQLLFDRYNVHSVMMVPTPILLIFSVGLTTGLVIESGEGITFVATILNGRIQRGSVRRLDLGKMIQSGIKILIGINKNKDLLKQELIQKDFITTVNENHDGFTIYLETRDYYDKLFSILKKYKITGFNEISLSVEELFLKIIYF